MRAEIAGAMGESLSQESVERPEPGVCPDAVGSRVIAALVVTQ